MTPQQTETNPRLKRAIESDINDVARHNDLKGVDHYDMVDILTIVVILIFSGVSLTSIVARWPWYVSFINVGALAVISFFVTYRIALVRPDHLRAQQSDLIMRIARESLGYMRAGLNPATAAAVCEIILRNTQAAVAVGITDRTNVLGFAGVGINHHSAGRTIVTRATRSVLEENASRVLTTKAEIGCPDPTCPLVAAIVVPLQAQNRAIGTLKFYYDDDRHLNETELTMAEGLAGLLSTQLEIHELEMQAELTTEMELKALQAQINPHFLFNTLNTISSFIRTDPVAARDLLRKFAQFYRHTLEKADAASTLEDEIAFLEQYFALEQARFGDRLNMSVDINEDLRELPLPSFMLQPLVENCVAHGMRPDGEPLTITVSAHHEEGHIIIAVADDGVGIPADKLPTIFEEHSGKGLGIALRNVRDRLTGVYGAGSAFRIESTEGVGTRAYFVIEGATPDALPNSGTASTGQSPAAHRA